MPFAPVRALRLEQGEGRVTRYGQSMTVRGSPKASSPEEPWPQPFLARTRYDLNVPGGNGSSSVDCVSVPPGSRHSAPETKSEGSFVRTVSCNKGSEVPVCEGAVQEMSVIPVSAGLAGKYLLLPDGGCRSCHR